MTSAKRCTGCGEWKLPDEFYRKASDPSGRARRCKDCESRAKRESRSPRNRTLEQQSKERWKQRNREKVTAHRKLYKALRRGRLRKPESCESCGRVARLHGHHKDYEKPLEVQWLCSLCHKATHAEEQRRLAA